MPFHALITGTGADVLDDLGVAYDERLVETRYGTVYIQECRYHGEEFLHLNRHLSTGQLAERRFRLPMFINHRANVLALAIHGAERILATTAVGSIDPEYGVGDIALVDEFLTPTFDSQLSFADESSGPEFFREMTDPVCHVGRELFYAHLRRILPSMITVHGRARLSIIRGPAYETKSDIERLQLVSVKVVGMETALNEIVLAGELDICCDAAALITDNPAVEAKHADIEAIARERAPFVFDAAVETFRQLVDDNQATKCACGIVPVVGLRDKLRRAA